MKKKGGRKKKNAIERGGKVGGGVDYLVRTWKKKKKNNSAHKQNSCSRAMRKKTTLSIFAVIAAFGFAAIVPSTVGLSSSASELLGPWREIPSHSPLHSVSSGHLWVRRCWYLQGEMFLIQRIERRWWIHGGIFWRQQWTTLMLGSHMKLSKRDYIWVKIKKKEKRSYYLPCTRYTSPLIRANAK